MERRSAKSCEYVHREQRRDIVSAESQYDAHWQHSNRVLLTLGLSRCLQIFVSDTQGVAVLHKLLLPATMPPSSPSEARRHRSIVEFRCSALLQ